MTEAVEEVQDVTASSNRVRIALISATVPVVLAAIGLVPRLIDDTAPPKDTGGAVIAELSTTPASVSPKLWKIKVELEPEEPVEAVRLVRVIQDLSPDSDGQVVFTDVPKGVYRLYVVLDDREIDVTVDTDESHKNVRPPIRGVRSTEQ